MDSVSIARLAIFSLAIAGIPLAISMESRHNPRDIRLPDNFKWIVVSIALFIPFKLWIMDLTWGIVLFSLSLWGLYRFIVVGVYRLEENLISLGWVQLAVAGMWFVSSNFSFPVLGFFEPWKTLTSAHFHMAAFAGLYIWAIQGRTLAPGLYRNIWRTCSLMGAFSIWLLAFGIAISPLLEVVSALILSISFFGNSILLIMNPINRFTKWNRLSGIANILAMVLAVGFAVGQWSGKSFISINVMAWTHGVLNTFGYALPLLIVTYLDAPNPLINTTKVPLSRLRTNRKCNRHIVDQMGWNRINNDGNNRKNPMTGLVNQIEELANPEFDPSFVHPYLRDFYQNVPEWSMEVETQWSFGFRMLSKLWSLLSEEMGQMRFQPATGISEMKTYLKSKIIPISAREEERNDVRAWIRTYGNSDDTIYAAFYSTHQAGDWRYMNIAFPFQLGQMTSILRFVARSNGVDVTTLSRPNHMGDEGIYFVRGQFAARLPLNETISVWPIENLNEQTIKAKHNIWVFGIKFLELNYYMRKKS